jgi:hypothetical protein
MANAKTRRAERKAAKLAGAAKSDPAPAQTFETEEAANEALAGASKVVNMKERQRENEAKAEKKKKRTSGLPVLPKLPKTKKDRPEHPCACGCGEMTKARFAPGHDSYIRAWAIRVERKVVKLSEVPEAHREAVKNAIKERIVKAKAKAAEEAEDAIGKDEGDEEVEGDETEEEEEAAK